MVVSADRTGERGLRGVEHLVADGVGARSRPGLAGLQCHLVAGGDLLARLVHVVDGHLVDARLLVGLGIAGGRRGGRLLRLAALLGGIRCAALVRAVRRLAALVGRVRRLAGLRLVGLCRDRLVRAVRRRLWRLVSQRHRGHAEEESRRQRRGRGRSPPLFSVSHVLPLSPHPGRTQPHRPGHFRHPSEYSSATGHVDKLPQLETRPRRGTAPPGPCRSARSPCPSGAPVRHLQIQRGIGGARPASFLPDPPLRLYFFHRHKRGSAEFIWVFIARSPVASVRRRGRQGSSGYGPGARVER